MPRRGLRHLPDDVIEPLTIEMARKTEIDHETAKDVLEEVVDLSFARGYLAEGGASFAREALEGRSARSGPPRS